MKLKTVCAIATLFLLCDRSHGGIIETFQVDSNGGGVPSEAGSIDAGVFTLEKNLVADGVSFSARLTVSGSDNNGPAPVANNGNGIGVNGNTVNADNAETLRFEVSIFNPYGGTVVFDGFTAIDFNSFSSSTPSSVDEATINGIAISGAQDNVNLTEAPYNLPTTLTIVGGPSTGTSFQIDDVTLMFSGLFAEPVAIPEPSSFALLSLCGIGLAAERRRKARKARSIDEAR